MNQFKKARLLAGMDQKELAQKLGVTNVTVSKWENGEMLPKAKRLKEVAAVLNTTIGELLNEGG